MKTARTLMLSILVSLGCVLLLWGQAGPAKTQGGIWVGKWEKDGVVAGSIRLLSPTDGGNYFQSMMHPDGTRVCFWGKAAGEKGFDIYVAKVDGSDLRKVTTDQSGNSGPYWTADGKRIVWASNRGSEGARIWVMDADGKNPKQVTSGAGKFHDERPCVSPDNKWVVFESTRPTGGREVTLWKAPLAGGKAEQVTTHHGRRPVFSHDGKRLACFTNIDPPRGSNIAVMDWPDGKPVFPLKLKPGDNLRGPFWTPDDKRIIAHGRLDAAPTTRTYLIDIAEGTVKEVPVPGSISSGHMSWDKAEKMVTFDGAREME